MDVRIGLCFLVLLIGSLASADARSLMLSDASIMQMNYQQLDEEIQDFAVVAKKDVLCEYCEQLTTLALSYLGENKTQTEVIELLHVACSRFHTLKTQCNTLVDYYAPLFFLELTTIEPSEFCEKVNLCNQNIIISQERSQDSCSLCHYAVDEVLVKLKDPDIQLEIMEMLLKGCNVVDNYLKECKKLVVDYVPLILANAEEYLEGTDLCTTIHACKASVSRNQEAISLVKISSLSES